MRRCRSEGLTVHQFPPEFFPCGNLPSTRGAATATWAATSALLEGEGGLYLEDCNVAAMATPERPYAGVHPHALDPEAAERLWALSEELVGEVG